VAPVVQPLCSDASPRLARQRKLNDRSRPGTAPQWVPGIFEPWDVVAAARLS